MSAPTVIQLYEIGITDIFGVPGDYSFPINDAICEHPQLRWIGCSNELNAAYAADGYARIRGVGAVCTTYGVGELSAINGIAGAYAEHLPLFHLVGTPNMRTQVKRALMHHTLGNGEYGLFQRMTEPVVCAQAVMTPQNAVFETERLIAEALYHRRPVYMAFPADYANMPVTGSVQPLQDRHSDPDALEKAISHILDRLESAGTACLLPGILVARTRQQSAMKAFIEASDLPFATMFMGKSVIDEQHPNYIGMYDGKLMNEGVQNFVESCDLVLKTGTILSDFNSGAFTAKLDPAKTIDIGHHQVQVGEKIYFGVEFGDILSGLTARVSKKTFGWKQLPANVSEETPESEGDPITAGFLYQQWEDFLAPGDILVAETGTVSMGLGFARMPAGASFHNQTLWGSIGWATPAAFGAAVAAPGQRVVLVTGDGAHQMTAQEVGQFYRYGIRPVIFVLNNSGYLIERLLCTDPEIEYNDIADWQYAALPVALGCKDWFTARVTTCGELDKALATAARNNTASYIEVVTGAYEASPLALQLHDTFRNI